MVGIWGVCLVVEAVLGGEMGWNKCQMAGNGETLYHTTPALPPQHTQYEVPTFGREHLQLQCHSSIYLISIYIHSTHEQ